MPFCIAYNIQYFFFCKFSNTHYVYLNFINLFLVYSKRLSINALCLITVGEHFYIIQNWQTLSHNFRLCLFSPEKIDITQKSVLNMSRRDSQIDKP